MGRIAVVVGALLIAAGGAALGYAFTRTASGGMTAAASAAMERAIGQLDGELRAARTAVHERAVTIAAQPDVVNTAPTDLGTARDQVTDRRLVFAPNPNERIELGQLEGGAVAWTASRGAGDPAVVVRGPDEGASASYGGAPGIYVELGGEAGGAELLLAEVVPVALGPDGRGKAAYVMVRRAIPLAPALDQLAAQQLAGWLEVRGSKRAFGDAPEGAALERRQLPSEPAATLVLAAPRQRTLVLPMPVVVAGATAAGVGLVALVIGLLLRSRDPGARAGTPAGPGAEAAAPPPPPASEAPTVPGVAAAPTAPGVTGMTGVQGAQAAPAALGPGAVLGRWELLRRLGSGGMADVYLAHARGEAGFEKLVAIKVMHGHLARNERAVELFLDEARLAARIHHPNVVGIQDLGKIGDDYVIVMDYVDGVDLERLLAGARAAGRPVPIAVALGILGRICDGLHAAHTATGPDGAPLGIIHRDVKSANVLVSRQGGVKVVDFGIAKASAQAHLTIAGETKGTPATMAPEQRVGDEVDVRADVYAVGAVGYELLTGRAVNLDLAALAHLGIEDWPHLPAPSSVRPELPPELDALLFGAMAFERERRPADCAAFEAALEAVAKRHDLTASDKDLARWVERELADPVQG